MEERKHVHGKLLSFFCCTAVPVSGVGYSKSMHQPQRHCYAGPRYALLSSDRCLRRRCPIKAPGYMILRGYHKVQSHEFNPPSSSLLSPVLVWCIPSDCPYTDSRLPRWRARTYLGRSGVIGCLSGWPRHRT